jgi:hypothetical protein
MIRFRNPLRSLFGTAHGIADRRVPNPGDVDACVVAASRRGTKEARRARLQACGVDPDDTSVTSRAPSRLAERRWRLPAGQRWVRAGDLRGD